MRLSALRPLVAGEARDCPNPVVDRALIGAARELCGAVPIWREAVTINVTGPGDYALTVETEGAEIARPISGPCAGGHVVSAYSYPDLRTLRIDSWPRDAADVDVVLALRPAVDASALPDVLASDHETALHAGALYRLLRMPGVAWSNPDLSMYYGRLFRARRGQAIAAHNRGIGNSGARAQPRRFAVFRR